MKRSILELIKCRGAWCKIERKYRINERDMVVMMFQKNPQLNELAEKHMLELKSEKKLNRIIILTDNKKNKMIQKVGREHNIIELSIDKIYKILYFYQMYIFKKYFFIVSLTEPQYNTRELFLATEGIDYDLLVRCCVFQLLPKE